ncbi:nucleotidyltransferase domain-containing protein [Candidatus Pacearchaeota archaeon]|nr:nucleotidyltransferase domain-containing protein [Candidatus Pacearchaeota archaeon]
MIPEQKLIRKVTRIGNGAHIFAPKEWEDEEVMLIRIPKKDVKKEIISLLMPYLDKITAVFLYGSYARNEETKESDVDVFIISSEKFNIKKKGYEIINITEKNMDKAIKINPIMIYSMLNEAVPIINTSLLDKLKDKKINVGYFKDFIQETKQSIKTSEQLINIDKEKNSDYLSSNSVIYSLILRLRGIFLIKKLLKKEKYSNKLFKKYIINEIKDLNYDKIFKIYRLIRDDKSVKSSERIKIKDADSLLSLLKKEVNKINLK